VHSEIILIVQHDSVTEAEGHTIVFVNSECILRKVDKQIQVNPGYF